MNVRIPRTLSWRLALFPALLVPGPAAAQVSNQSFQVAPEVDSASVGDTVTLRFRVRLDERDLLFDTVPQPVVAPPPGVRILSIDKLTRAPDRIFYGRARVAFYRTGHRAVPVFGLPFMSGVRGVLHGTLASDSAFVRIVSLLPAGNPSLKDIREIEIVGPRSPWILVVAVTGALLLLLGYLRLRRRRARVSTPVEPAPIMPALPSTAFELALEQLRRIERGHWPEQGHVARHYQATVGVLRQYLAAREGLPAGERTTEELVWTLPPHLSDNGQRDQLRELLDQADLVKFARLRPHPEAAERFLEHCRGLLRQWHEMRPSEAMAEDNALR